MIAAALWWGLGWGGWLLCQAAAVLKGLAVVGKVAALVGWAVRLACVAVAACRGRERGAA
jgi:hypothetical protein